MVWCTLSFSHLVKRPRRGYGHLVKRPRRGYGHLTKRDVPRVPTLPADVRGLGGVQEQAAPRPALQRRAGPACSLGLDP